MIVIVRMLHHPWYAITVTQSVIHNLGMQMWKNVAMWEEICSIYVPYCCSQWGIFIQDWSTPLFRRWNHFGIHCFGIGSPRSSPFCFSSCLSWFSCTAYIAIDYNLYIYIFIHLCLRPNIHQYVQLFFLQIIYVGTIEVGPMPQHAISCNHRDGVGYTVYPRWLPSCWPLEVPRS